MPSRTEMAWRGPGLPPFERMLEEHGAIKACLFSIAARKAIDA